MSRTARDYYGRHCYRSCLLAYLLFLRMVPPSACSYFHRLRFRRATSPRATSGHPYLPTARSILSCSGCWRRGNRAGAWFLFLAGSFFSTHVTFWTPPCGRDHPPLSRAAQPPLFLSVACTPVPIHIGSTVKKAWTFWLTVPPFYTHDDSPGDLTRRHLCAKDTGGVGDYALSRRMTTYNMRFHGVTTAGRYRCGGGNSPPLTSYTFRPWRRALAG